ncbi:hypothetical protein [Actinoallomurus sp. NPDC050550]|uniref:hypothetical protein n=1 Tax=Actinoallomurus sp. NPDC050550 TaxID=3154937 RepID=UPI0033C556BB
MPTMDKQKETRFSRVTVRRSVMLPRVTAIPAPESLLPTETQLPLAMNPRPGDEARTELDVAAHGAETAPRPGTAVVSQRPSPRHRASDSGRDSRSIEPPKSRRRGAVGMLILGATGVAGLAAVSFAVMSTRGGAHHETAAPGLEPASPPAVAPTWPVGHPTPSTSVKGKGSGTSTSAPGGGKSSPVKTPHTSATPPAAKHWQTMVVQSTAVLHPGESAHTNRLTLRMQTDGDLVLLNENKKVFWLTGTHASGASAVFQGDGNLVVYASNGASLWTSNTAGHVGATLTLRADGAMTIDYQGAVLWSTGVPR